MTDASLHAWGAHLDGAWTQGTWSTQEMRFSSNRLESRAIRLALLLQFHHRVQGRHLLIYTDNVSAKAFVNRQVGTRSQGLMREASLLFDWAESHLASIKAEHLSGESNLEVDWLSRHEVKDGEWALLCKVFNQIVDRFGLPTLDLFASRDNAQLPAFLSGLPDPQGNGDGCAFLSVAQDAAVRLSTFPSHPSSSSQGASPLGRTDTGGPQLASQTLVSGDCQSSPGATFPSALQTRPSLPGPSISSGPREAPTDSLAFERRQLTLKGYSQGVISTFLSSRRASSNTVYSRTWHRFVLWANVRNLQVAKARRKHVLQCLQDGVDRGSVPTLLRGNCPPSVQFWGLPNWVPFRPILIADVLFKG